jgi:hypothetical protein
LESSPDPARSRAHHGHSEQTIRQKPCFLLKKHLSRRIA